MLIYKRSLCRKVKYPLIGKMHAGTGHSIARGFTRGSEVITSYLKLSNRIDVGPAVYSVIFETASQLKREESRSGISVMARLGRLRILKVAIYDASMQKASRPWLPMAKLSGQARKQ
jgi:hypothetical protein